MSLENDQIIENWEFPWQIMEVLIDGKSSIDLTQLNITSEQEAHDFVLAYGLNPDLEQDQRFIHKTIVEALSFVEKVLMPKEWKSGRQAPDEILECDDVRQLLIWASLGAREMGEVAYCPFGPARFLGLFILLRTYKAYTHTLI